MACWKELIERAARDRGETLADIEACTLTEAELAQEFDPGFGGLDGAPFTAWSASAVYFPVCFDGSEWVGSVSRHPDGNPTPHQGGGFGQRRSG